MPSTSTDAPLRAGTVLVGLVGRGIALSRTPAMHEVEGRALGFAYSYRRFDLDEPAMAHLSLAEVIGSAEAQGFAGLNSPPRSAA